MNTLIKFKEAIRLVDRYKDKAEKLITFTKKLEKFTPKEKRGISGLD